MKKIKNHQKITAIIVAASVFGIAITTVISMHLLFGSYDYVFVDLKNHIEAQEYIEKGWIPEYMPKDSNDIAVSYLLDDNRVNGQFRASKEGIATMASKLSPATVDDLNKTPEAVDRMYDDIKITLGKEPDGISFYQDDVFIYAISTDETVYFFGK